MTTLATNMNARIAALSVACLLAGASSHAQGTFQITFDGPPIQPPGTAYTVTNYFESGMSFMPVSGGYGFGRVGPATSGYPDSGTVHLKAALGDSLMFSFAISGAFGLTSVDLAEYSTFFAGEPVTVQFIGYYTDGSTVTTSFTTDGIIDGTGPLVDFQTFYFDKAWTGLTRVEIPSFGWSLDNLVVSVPEPGVGSLLLVGAGILGLRRFKRKEMAR